MFNYFEYFFSSLRIKKLRFIKRLGAECGIDHQKDEEIVYTKRKLKVEGVD